MQVSAHLNHLRMSPRKVRLVADLVRGLDIADADAQLAHASRAAALPLRKLLASAVANAEHNAKLTRTNLFVERMFVNQGPTAKRFRARAFGRAAVIRKRSSHVTVILGERVPTTPAASTHTAVLPPPVVVLERPRGVPPMRSAAEAHGAPEASRATEATAEQEQTDVRRKGKHRHQQHEDARSGKHPGGFFKRFFTRRSGER